MVVETGSNKSAKKKKKDKKAPRQQNIINPKPKSKITGLEALDEDARWKSEAVKCMKKIELRDASEEEEAQFQSEEMEKIKNWNFDPVKMKKAKKPSFWRKMGAYTAWGMGKLVGTALQILTLGHYRRAKAAVRLATADTKNGR